MPSSIFALFLLIPLLCPQGMIETPDSDELVLVNATTIHEWYPYWIQKSKQEAFLLARGAKTTPPPKAEDVGNIAVVVDDGTILTKSTFDGGFLGGPTYIIDDFAAMRAFYRTHGDDYDAVIIFMQEQMSFSQGFAHADTLDNRTLGLGDRFGSGERLVDNGPFAGTRGRLQGFSAMNCICFPGNDPFLDFGVFFGGAPTFYTIMDVMAQEYGHKRLAFPLVRDPDGELSLALLGRQLAHWNFFSQSGGSPLEGNQLIETEPNIFLSAPTERPFSDLDLYLLGFLPPQAVEPFFYVDQITEIGVRDRNVATGPAVGVEFVGRRRNVTIGNVIAANGPRMPAANASNEPVRERHAFILVVPEGFSPDPLAIEQMETFRLAWQDHFATITQGRAVADTELVKVDPKTLPPVGVSVLDNRVGQGSVDFLTTANVLHGQNLDAIEVPEGGVEISILNRTEETVDLSISVDLETNPGPRALIFRDALGNEHRVEKALHVLPRGTDLPAPLVERAFLSGRFKPVASPGTRGVRYFIIGDFFAENATVEFSGEGVLLEDIQIQPNFIFGNLTVAEDAETGFRDITIINPDGQRDVVPNILPIAVNPEPGPFVPVAVLGGGGCSLSTGPSTSFWIPFGFLLFVFFFSRRTR